LDWKTPGIFSIQKSGNPECEMSRPNNCCAAWLYILELLVVGDIWPTVLILESFLCDTLISS